MHSKIPRRMMFVVLTIFCMGASVQSRAAFFGDVDTTFGSSTTFPGYTDQDLGGTGDFGADVVTGLDDRLYVLGYSCASGSCFTPANTLVVTRYSASGVVDPTFGAGGTLGLMTDVGTDVHLEVDDAGGRIYIGLVGCESGTNCRLSVLRFDFNGNLDTTYGTHGVASVASTDTAGFVSQLLLQSDGKLLVLGEQDTRDGSTQTGSHIVLGRLNRDGTVDTTFGTSGLVDVSVGSCDEFGAISLGLHGAIFVTSAMRNACGDAPTPALTKVTSAGALDSTFGTGGHVVGNEGTTGNIAGEVAQEQADGTIAYVLTGVVPHTGLQFDTVTLKADGSFVGQAQHSVYQTAGKPFSPTFATVQTTGKVVFTGAFAGTDSDEGLNRLAGSPLLARAARGSYGQSAEQGGGGGDSGGSFDLLALCGLAAAIASRRRRSVKAN